MLLNYYHSEQVTLAIFFNITCVISRYHKYTCMYIFLQLPTLLENAKLCVSSKLFSSLIVSFIFTTHIVLSAAG